MAEEKKHHHLFGHHKKEEDKPIDAVPYSETGYSEPTYAGDSMDGYGKTTEAFAEKPHDYEKEEEKHKKREHKGEVAAVGAGAYGLYEKHKAKKDPENEQRHKIEEEIAAAVAVGGGGYAFHEKHDKKEVKEDEEEAEGKKKHHLF